MTNPLASLVVIAAGAVAVGATWLAVKKRRAARMPRKPEDLSRWESEGGAARPDPVSPPVDKA